MAQINKPNLHFNTKLYTGNAGTQSITGVGFQPDLTWIKRRNTTGGNMWTDAVRGVTKTIISNETSAEQTFANGLTAFGTDGFTVGSEGGFNSANTIASWNWKAGGSGSANTDGDINSTVSANTAAGFSIVKWTGNGTNSDQEIGTGLSEELKFVISKPLDAGGGTSQWLIYANGTTDAQNHCFLFTTGSKTTNATGGTPNKGTTAGRLLLKAGSSSNANLNTNALNYIAYCFAEKKGYSKFGTYTGNGNSDGAFVYTGFKPAWFMIKSTGSGNEWYVWDNKRDIDNPGFQTLYASSNIAEFYSSYGDFLSNGFKARSVSGGINSSGQEYIYMAIAENPIVGTNNIPATAR